VKEHASLYEILNHPNIAIRVAIQTRKRVLMTVIMHCVGVASCGKNKENKEKE